MPPEKCPCPACKRGIKPQRATPTVVCNFDELADLLKTPQLEAGFALMCDIDTGEPVLVVGVYDEEAKAWEWKNPAGDVIDPTTLTKCPDTTAVPTLFCDTDNPDQTWTRVMCKVGDAIDPTKTQWINNLDNTVSATAPTTLTICTEEEKCEVIPVQPMVDKITVGEAEEICDFENGTLLFEENFETPSTTQGTGIGTMQTDFDVSQAGQPAYWGQMYAEGIYRVFPGGYVPVGPPDPDIHFNWLPYAPYSTGHISFNLQASTGAAGLRPFFMTIPMVAGKCYTLVIDAMDTHEQSVVDQGVDLAELALVINGAIVGNTGPITAGTGTDQGNVYTISFTAQTTGPQLMEFVSGNTATNGNDIYVDYVRIYEGDVTIVEPEVTCVEFERVHTKCPDGTFTVENVKDGAEYVPEGEVHAGTCADQCACDKSEDDGAAGGGGGDFDDTGIITAIEDQTDELLDELCKDEDTPLIEESGTGNIPAGFKSVTINNISGDTTINGGFVLGSGRRLNSISYGTDRGNCVNELLPAYTITGGTWQWTGLRE